MNPERTMQTGTSSSKRVKAETSAWFSCLERYKELKEEGWDGMTPRGHELEKWVQKQRTLARQGKLMPWKRALLEEAKFNLQAPRNASTPTDQEYANMLVAFYKENGHCAPTQTFGGAGLTKWWTKFKASGGRAGLVSGSAASAQDAVRILDAALPPGYFAAETKSVINIQQGLTFNGFIPNCDRAPTIAEDLQVHLDLSPRYSLLLQKVREQTRFRNTYLSLSSLLQRAELFSQALRVDFSDSPDAAWLVDIEFLDEGDIDIARCTFMSNLLSKSTYSRHIHIRRTPTGYLDQGSRYGAVYSDTSGALALFSYDALLADQTSRLLPPALQPEFFEGRGIAATVTFDDDAMDKLIAHADRRMSAATTANIHFQTNFQELRVWVEQFNPERTPHIVWAKPSPRFKFIEHMNRKFNEGSLGFSHAEQLRTVYATWGRDRRTLNDLFGPISPLNTDNLKV